MLFSFSAHTQPRYLEAFTPAVAIALGCALPVVVARARDLFGVYVLIATFAIAMLEGAAETASGKHGYLAISLSALLAAPTTLYVIAGLPQRARSGRWPAGTTPIPVTLGMLGAVLALSAVRDVLLIRDHSGVAGGRGHDRALDRRPGLQLPARHQGATRYEAAFTATTVAAPFIVDAGRPVLLLTSIDGQPFVTKAQLQTRPRQRAGSLRLHAGRLHRLREDTRGLFAGDGVGSQARTRRQRAGRSSAARTGGCSTISGRRATTAKR